jgi:hypothetical protein
MPNYVFQNILFEKALSDKQIACQIIFTIFKKLLGPRRGQWRDRERVREKESEIERERERE